jgi:Zn-finger nucleic acid-binding protein
MELFDRRRYYSCNHCGTFHFMDTPAIEGVHVLGPHDVARSCPICTATLMRALLDDRATIEHCEQCRGLLMPRQAFGEAVWARRASASGPGLPPQPLDSRELKRHIACPSCDQKMDVHPYFGPGNIVIDSCSTCDLIWLDHGELKQITDAPGRDRGTGAAVPRATAADSEPPPPMRLSGRISLLDLWDLLE